MNDSAPESLILDLLEWLEKRDRTYEEVMDAWRTSCPKTAGLGGSKRPRTGHERATAGMLHCEDYVVGACAYPAAEAWHQVLAVREF